MNRPKRRVLACVLAVVAIAVPATIANAAGGGPAGSNVTIWVSPDTTTNQVVLGCARFDKTTNSWVICHAENFVNITNAADGTSFTLVANLAKHPREQYAGGTVFNNTATDPYGPGGMQVSASIVLGEPVPMWYDNTSSTGNVTHVTFTGGNCAFYVPAFGLPTSGAPAAPLQ